MTKNNTKHAAVIGIAAVAKKSTHTHRRKIATSGYFIQQEALVYSASCCIYLLKMNKFILIILFLCNICVHAQYGNNWTSPWKNWIDFNTEPPSLKTCEAKTQLQGGWAVNSILTGSDSMGRLSIYNSSDTLYNNKHNIIKNGTGVNMYRPLCIPINGGKQFLIVHSNIKDQTTLLYTLVNMEGDNGNGEVTQKNIWLQKKHDEFNGIKTYTPRTGGGYWLITRGRFDIYAFPIVDTIIQDPIITSDPDTAKYNTNGFIFSVSNDGKMALRDRWTFPKYPNGNNQRTEIIAYDFDNITGLFSNKKIVLARTSGLTEAGLTDVNMNYTFSDVVFSPNDSIIYILNIYANSNNDSVLLYQLERYSNQKELAKVSICYNLLGIPSEMRLAPNGKIYISFLDYYDTSFKYGIHTLFYCAILNPDYKGSKCNFQQKQLLIKNNVSMYDTTENNLAPGLPRILFEYLKVKYIYDISCGGNVTFYNLSDTNKFTNYTWYFGDGDSLYNSTFLPFVKHKYGNPNKYFVKLKATNTSGYSAWYSDSVLIDSNIISPIASYKVSSSIGCQWNKYNFIDNSQSLYNSSKYTWYYNFGDSIDTIINSKVISDGSVTHIYNKTGNYTARLIFSNGYCTDTFADTQQIFIKPAPQPGLILNPTNGCVPQLFQIKPLYQDTIVSEKYYVYNSLGFLKDSFINKPNLPSIPTGFNLNQKDSGLYTIKQILTGTTGCITQDSVTIQLNSRPYLKLLNDTFICSDEVLQLAATAGYRFKWNTGDTTQNIIINKAGTYWVKETYGGCTVEDSTVITQDYDEHCKFNISVYPNPFGNEFKIAVYSRTTQNINVQLYETSGKQVASYNNIPVNQFTTISVSTTDLASAMYILHITTNNKKFTYKMVKLVE